MASDALQRLRAIRALEESLGQLEVALAQVRGSAELSPEVLDAKQNLLDAIREYRLRDGGYRLRRAEEAALESWREAVADWSH